MASALPACLQPPVASHTSSLSAALPEPRLPHLRPLSTVHPRVSAPPRDRKCLEGGARSHLHFSPLFLRACHSLSLQWGHRELYRTS